MRSTWTISILVLGASLIGCNQDNGSSNKTIIPITSTSSNNEPANNSAPSSTIANNEASTNSASSDRNKPAATGTTNPDRIFQLSNLATTTIKTTGGDLKLWVMDNEDKRREGMMFLHNNEVKDNEGMIFVFPEVQKLSGNYAFWMHNTILPLDIDYISKEKKVLNVGLGKAMNDDPVKPTGDYFYVIELKQGMSAKYGLTAGAKVQISDELKGKP